MRTSVITPDQFASGVGAVLNQRRIRFYYAFHRGKVWVYKLNREGYFGTVGLQEKGCRDVKQAVCDVIAANVKLLARFPEGFTPPRHTTLSDDRRMLRFLSGFNCNYPAYLSMPSAREREKLELIQLPIP